MSKHTPGPWQWEKRGGAFRAIEGASGTIVAVTEEYAGDAWIDISEANARLIAAAPELLIELRQAVIQMGMAADCIQNGRYDEALLYASSLMRSKRAAIAKATGE